MRCRTSGAVTPESPTDGALRAVGAALLAQALAAAGRAVQGLDAATACSFGTSALWKAECSSSMNSSWAAWWPTTWPLGDWESAERELADYAADQPRAAAAFGGSIEVLRGYSLLRQGRIERAYQTLLPAVETLRLNDPLQVFRFGSSLGVLCGSEAG